jgi:hypothetical protein
MPGTQDADSPPGEPGELPPAPRAKDADTACEAGQHDTRDEGPDPLPRYEPL